MKTSTLIIGLVAAVVVVGTTSCTEDEPGAPAERTTGESASNVRETPATIPSADLPDDAPAAPWVRIVTTIHPFTLLLNDLVEPADREYIQVDTIIPARFSPWGYEPTEQDLELMRAADLVVCNGGIVDGWVFQHDLGGTNVLCVAAILSELQGSDDTVNGADAGPYYWVDPVIMPRFGTHLVREIVRVLRGPDHTVQLQQNLKDANTTFRESAQQLEIDLANTLGPINRPLVCSRGTIGWLVTRYALGDVMLVDSSDSALMTAAADHVRETGAALVLDDPFGAGPVTMIALTTEQLTFMADPICMNCVTWTEMMTGIGDVLAELSDPDGGSPPPGSTTGTGPGG